MEEGNDRKSEKTEHGMLVAWGYFAKKYGLTEKFKQKVKVERHHQNIEPADLILEFGLLLLSGGVQLQDLNHGSHPLVKDQVVQRIWGIKMGHYTTVSRVLKAATAETVAQVVQVLDEFSQPFLEREIEQIGLQGKKLTLFADLTGRAVSVNSQTYPEAQWGYMDGTLEMGYQYALISFQGQSYRIGLAGFLHPGDTVSPQCLGELVEVAEKHLQCHPYRRVHLLQERIEHLQKQLEEVACQDTSCQMRLIEKDELYQSLQAQIAEQQLAQQARDTKSAKVQSQLEKYLKRSQRTQQEAQIIHNQKIRLQEKTNRLQMEKERLQSWQDRLRSENENNPNPVPIRILLDGAFSSGENLAYLIELGYDLITLGNGQCVQALQRELPAEPIWQEASLLVKLWEGNSSLVGKCPYKLRRILQKWRTEPRTRYSIMLVYENTPFLPLPEVFSTYHQRQSIEAGNRQGKSSLNAKHIRVRSPAALVLLNLFAFIFWPNFIHWASDWLQEQNSHFSPHFQACLETVRNQVRVGAQTTAFLTIIHDQIDLVFSSDGPFAGSSLHLNALQVYQLFLPFFVCQLPISLECCPLLSKPPG